MTSQENWSSHQTRQKIGIRKGEGRRISRAILCSTNREEEE